MTLTRRSRTSRQQCTTVHDISTRTSEQSNRRALNLRDMPILLQVPEIPVDQYRSPENVGRLLFDVMVLSRYVLRPLTDASSWCLMALPCLTRAGPKRAAAERRRTAALNATNTQFQVVHAEPEGTLSSRGIASVFLFSGALAMAE